MSEPIIAAGEKVHIVSRRIFDGDLRRHFAGRVVAVSENQIRAEGYVFVFNASKNEYIRRKDKRTRLFSLADAGNVINVLPKTVEIDSLEYRHVDQRLVVTDNASFSLDINEFGPVS